ncbi:MAG: penicillin-binding protein 1C [Rhizobiaceae bacterium]
MRRWFLIAVAVTALSAALAGLAGWTWLDSAIEQRVLQIREPALSREVLDRNGRLLLATTSADERWRMAVDIERVDKRYLDMLIAFEDRRFREHGGIDPKALARATWQAARHWRIVSGASTLTMQAARLVSRLPAKSVPAKIEQMLMALALERGRSKDEILSIYLTRAPYGGNLEGVRAASWAWFGKEPYRLTAAEAALLVALPQAPGRYRPDRNQVVARAARDRVLKRAYKLRLINRGTLIRALATNVPTTRFSMPMLAAHAGQRLINASKGDFDVQTTLDAGLQTRLERLARGTAEALSVQTSLAILVADHRDGSIVASVGSPDIFDEKREGYVDLTRAVRSPGSTLKPFIYGLAFEHGIAHPESILSDSPASFAGYRPGNFDHRYEGELTARRALQLSRNLPAIELLSMVGPLRLTKRLEQAGATLHLSKTAQPGLAIGLGGVGMTLTDLVTLYAGLANGGEARALRISDDESFTKPYQILTPDAAWYLASILSGAKTTSAESPGSFAFKTGTSYGYRDAWAIGFDGRYAAGVWIGRPDGAPVPGLSGERSAVPVLHDVFSRLKGRRPLQAPPAGILPADQPLPPAMKRIGQAKKNDPGDRPQIVFPPADAELTTSRGVPTHLALKLVRGRPPFTWFVDGKPVANRVFTREVSHSLTEPGFFDIAVVDAAGQASRVQVRAR